MQTDIFNVLPPGQSSSDRIDNRYALCAHVKLECSRLVFLADIWKAGLELAMCLQL